MGGDLKTGIFGGAWSTYTWSFESPEVRIKFTKIEKGPLTLFNFWCIVLCMNIYIYIWNNIINSSYFGVKEINLRDTRFKLKFKFTRLCMYAASNLLGESVQCPFWSDNVRWFGYVQSFRRTRLRYRPEVRLLSLRMRFAQFPCCSSPLLDRSVFPFIMSIGLVSRHDIHRSWKRTCLTESLLLKQ